MGNRKPKPHDKPKAFATMARKLLKDRKLTMKRFAQMVEDKSGGEVHIWWSTVSAVFRSEHMPTNRWPLIFTAALDLSPAQRDKLIAAARKDCEEWGAKKIVTYRITERFLLPHLPHDDAPAASPPEYPSSPASP